MSEYQFYEFKAIDKPLSKEDKLQIGSWSSRANPSSTGAVFTYSYGDFPKDEINVVEKYFDAMFYISNWGTTKLIFKFSKELIDIDKIKPYCIEDGLRIIEKSNCFLLDIVSSDEEGGRWIEGEGCLTSLISLRNDILNGDYRCLYLIWLKTIIAEGECEWSDNEFIQIEPPVPRQLNNLNGALQDFTDVFEIDKDIILAAAENSGLEDPEKVEEFTKCIEKLPDIEKDEFLVRLLNDEPLLGVKFKIRLKEFIGVGDASVRKENRRTIGEITKRIEEIKQERENEERKRREERLFKKLKDIELHEDELWRTVYQLISEKKTKAYDEAMKVLNDLKELSIHKSRFNDFCNKIEVIKQENSRLSGLQSRIESAKLTEK